MKSVFSCLNQTFLKSGLWQRITLLFVMEGICLDFLSLSLLCPSGISQEFVSKIQRDLPSKMLSIKEFETEWPWKERSGLQHCCFLGSAIYDVSRAKTVKGWIQESWHTENCSLWLLPFYLLTSLQILQQDSLCLSQIIPHDKSAENMIFFEPSLFVNYAVDPLMLFLTNRLLVEDVHHP